MGPLAGEFSVVRLTVVQRIAVTAGDIQKRAVVAIGKNNCDPTAVNLLNNCVNRVLRSALPASQQGWVFHLNLI